MIRLTSPSTMMPLLKRLTPVLVGLLVIALGLAAQAIAQDDEPEFGPTEQARRATVFLMQTYESAGTQIVSCVGSGTLIQEDGLILTNAHLASSLGPCRGERIVVSLPVRLDEPPVPTYVAEPIATDQALDLAVLQITGSLDGSLIDTETLNLPSVTIGDPSALLPGSGLAFVGYPDIGASSVTQIDGVVTGITAEQSGSGMAWLRTDSELKGGMSGGGAYDAGGQLVGIPTSAPGTDGNVPGPMCLSIQDDSRDGLITDVDTCVPIGGDITAIRPIVFARPLVEAATRGLRLDHAEGALATQPAGEPSVSRLFFSTGLTDFGQPADVISTAPSGITSLFFFFDYANLPAGTPYEIRVTRDGIEMPQFGIGPLSWGGSENGTWYVGSEGKTWPDGTYEFTILLNGEVAAAQSIQIGAAPDAQRFSGLIFSLPGGESQAGSSGVLFPAGVQRVNGDFRFSGMLEGQAWREVWYLDGSPVFDETRIWEAGSDGQDQVAAINSQGLPMGRYRLELYIGERLAATGDVTLAGSAATGNRPRIFEGSRLSSDIDREGLPDGQVGSSGMTMPLGVNSLYAFLDWDSMPVGLDWTYRWFLDGRLLGSSTQRWTTGIVGEDYWISLNSDAPLPEGNYSVEILVRSQPMFSASVSVGSGTQPVTGLEAETDEVFISGHVYDALTGEGVPGALVIVLDVMQTSATYTWDEADIHTQAITDQQGHFGLPRGLPRGNYYTMYVFAEDYITVVEDNLTILSTQDSPAEMVVEMSRP